MRESSHQAKRNHAAEYRDKGIRAYVILPDVTESAMRESRFARTPVVGSGVDRCMGRPLWRRPSCKVGAWVADVGGVVEGQGGEAPFRLELHWVVVGPVTPQFNVAQPWVKGYNGEVSLSISGHYSTVLTRVWIDQDLKREMGF